MKVSIRNVINLIVVLVLLQATAFSARSADTGPTRPDPKGPVSTPAPDSITPVNPRVNLPGTVNRLSKDLIGVNDATPIDVSIRGTMPSLAEVTKGLDAAGRLDYVAKVNAFQTEMEKGIDANGGTVLYRYHTLSSGVIASIPANKAVDIARLPGVAHVSRTLDYQLDLSETVGFIGGDTLKALGLKGQGVKVAVLDSGLDYTHLAFGGYADPTAWEAAYYGSDPLCINGNQPQCANRKAVDPMFSNLFGPGGMRVKGGFDWVGPVWPTGALEPDPNPIALKGTGDHGTHVADIIGGLGYPAGSYGTGPDQVFYPAQGEGMAPEADLYAFTVCSSVSTSCSGMAILQALDDAADLDNNPATVDPADVVNMSLGADYGQPEGDDVWMVNELTRYGTAVVIAAGNGGDRPYKVSEPSNASGAISVAQTAVPSAKQYRIIVNTPLSIAGDLTNQLISFSAPYYTHAITADVVFDNTDADTQRGCQADGVTPPAAWSGDGTRFAGKILLVNRGTCAASYKIANGQANGAVLVLIAMVTPGAPVDFSYGGGTLSIPGFTITLADGNKLKGAFATQPLPAALVTLANATTNPAVFISLAYTIATTSSRGPTNNDSMIKPEIGAPGASVSAVAGTGSMATAFGGTSGATPMVAGSIALLKDLFKDGQNFVDPQLSVAQYKALLMNSANNQIYENRTPANPTGDLLPINRIGAGQVDLTHALTTKILAYDVTSPDPLNWTGSLSFQYAAVTNPAAITRTLRILNLNPFDKTVVFGYDFRYSYQDNGAVTLTPSVDHVTVPAGKSVDVNIVMDIDPSALMPWFDWNNWWVVDRGSLGGDGQNFKQVEYDGYLWIGETLADAVIKETSVPFMVIPKPVADVTASLTPDEEEGTINLDYNAGATASHTDLFNLVDESPNQHYTVGDCASAGSIPGCSATIVDLKDVGYRMWQSATTSYIDFGISLWDNPFRSSPSYPVELDVYVDSVHPQVVVGAAPSAPVYVPGPDGFEDYVVYFTENGGFGASGQSVVCVENLHSAAAASCPYFLDSTFDSNNYILTVSAAAIGLNIPIATAQGLVAPASKMNFAVIAFDSYYTENATDFSPAAFATSQAFHSVDVLADRWHISMLYQNTTVEVGAHVEVPYTVAAPTDYLTYGSQIGFLAMYREAPIQQESKALVLGTKVSNLLFLPKIVAPGSAPVQ